MFSIQALKYYLGVGEGKFHFSEEEDLVMMYKNMWCDRRLFNSLSCLFETGSSFENFTVEIVTKDVTEM